MLRDILASNVVQRARSISPLLAPPQRCFYIRRASLDFCRRVPPVCSAAPPRLTGFEMVVTSANSTAVENVQ